MITDHSLLAIYSNPEDSDRLRLDRERRSLFKVLEGTGFRPSRLTVLDAASLDDILAALGKRPYSILHFSGHGGDTGIYVEDSDTGHGSLANVEYLKKVLDEGSPHLGIAVFLSCFSASFADELITHVPHIVAVKGSASDALSIRFVECFYSRLLAGDDIDHAYATATRRVGHLDVILLRRSVKAGISRALVRHHTREGDPSLYFDVSGAISDGSRLGLSEGDLLSLMARKVSYHAWAFRYPRSNAILSVGDFFSSFSWSNAEDCISCDRLFRLKDDASEDLSFAFARLLISYSDRYVANYRSPIAPYEPDYLDQVGYGLMKMMETCRSYFSEEGEERTSDWMTLSVSWPDLFREQVPRVFKASKAVCRANLVVAEQKFRSKDLGGCVAHLEAALSSLHDLMNGIGDQILE